MKSNHVITKVNQRIEIVSTDTETMKETGFGSLKTCRIITDILQKHYTDVSFREARTKDDLEDIVKRKPDLVVLCVKYISCPEKINLAHFFSQNNISHTGSNEDTLEYDSNKGKAKTVLLENGIATANFFLTQPDAIKNEASLPLALPLFVKPLDAANGNGVDENSIVRDWASFNRKVEEIFVQYGVNSIVEEILPGREFTVAVLEDLSTNTCHAYPVEIIAQKIQRVTVFLGPLKSQITKNELLLLNNRYLTVCRTWQKKCFQF